MSENLVVVVPVHQVTPSPLEEIALRQCGKIFAKRKILILAPKSLDLSAYGELLPNAGELRANAGRMSSREAYNRMMISPLIFHRLKEFSHMLLHEPDAIALKDEISEWTSQPYDYIGAPWFQGWGSAAADAPILGVGNWGFSLHRLEASRRVISSWRRWYSLRYVKGHLWHGMLGKPAELLKGLQVLGTAGLLRGAHHLYNGHCDDFWCKVIPSIHPDFRIAPADVAVRFAWEALPSRCMEMCNGQLPVGIHAWAKYDLEYLVPHLINAGVNLSGLPAPSSIA